MDQKRALITGGGSGIGLAVARRLAERGVEVTIAGRNADRLKDAGLPFLTVDVADEGSVKKCIRDAGRIDIFVANAGAAETAPAVKTSTELWDRMLAVNLTGAFLCAREALPAMIGRGWGRYIAVASTASLKGYAYASAYAAAKHGVLGLVRSLAIELAKTGVTANAVCPGFTDTDLVRNAVEAIARKTGRTPDDALASLVAANPMGRLIRPGDVAEAVAFLASEEAGAVNGQSIVVDGGEVIS